MNSYSIDPIAQELLTRLVVVSPDDKGFTLDHGIVKFHNKIWVANNFALITKLIAAFHSSAIGGHSGVKATYFGLKQLFFWKGLKKEVEKFVQQCLVSQQAKHELIHPSSLLQPLPIPQGAW